jgi:hypothetical protein
MCIVETAMAPILPNSTNLGLGWRLMTACACRHPVLAISTFACFILMAGLCPALEVSGFCFDQRRFLTDAEFLNAAFGAAIRRDRITVSRIRDGILTQESVPLPRFSNITQFKSDNPNCCKLIAHNVGDHGPHVGFDDRLFGHAARTAEVTFRSRVDGSPIFTPLYFVVTNCGRAWN